MQIGVVGPAEEDSFADNVMNSFKRMGYGVACLGPATPRTRKRAVSRALELAMLAAPELERRWQDRLVRRAAAAGCDFVLSVDRRLSPYTVSQLRAEGKRVALWFPDAVVNMGDQRMLLADYDAVFMTDPILVNRLRAMLGLRVFYLPEAFNPAWHKPIGEPGSEKYVAVVGSMYPSRSVLLERLINDGIPIRLFGQPFPASNRHSVLAGVHSGLFVRREEKSRVFRSAVGVLNNLHPAEFGVNCRLFEAAGAGAAVICEYRDELSAMYDTNTEVLAFENYNELVGRVSDLMSSQRLSREYGDAAAARSLAEHTYEHRLAVILRSVMEIGAG